MTWHSLGGFTHILVLKLISEIIRDLLWDWGLKQFCILCGIESDYWEWVHSVHSENNKNEIGGLGPKF